MSVNYYDMVGARGAAFVNTMFQAKGSIGGHRAVFVDVGGVKNELATGTWGGLWANPFKGVSKIYAGDLFELRMDDKGENGQVFLLKTFKVEKTSSSSDTTYKIERSGYRHIPFVGDILMKAPSAMDTAGKAYKVTNVVEAMDGEVPVWEVTLNTTLGTLTKGDILVEADKEHASEAKMLVQEINAVAPCDYDFAYAPMSGTASNANGVHVMIEPVLHGIMFTHRMSPLPACVLSKNRSRINGWFEI